MSSVVISGNTSGAITLSAPNVAGTNTITLPAVTGTMLTTATAGTVLQVKQTLYTTLVSSTSSTLVAAGPSISITPSSTSNKILASFSVTFANDTSSTGVTFAIYRNGSKVWPSTTPAAYAGAYFYSNWRNSGTFQFLDSPASTSAVTYALYFQVYGGNGTVQNDNTESVAIAMEIGG
jgi:hypothetical protein